MKYEYTLRVNLVRKYQSQSQSACFTILASTATAGVGTAS